PLLGAERHRQAEAFTSGAARRVPAEEAREALRANFAPPSVLVDVHAQILFFHGQLERFLNHLRGEGRLDLFTMARDDLRPRLRGAVRQAIKNGTRVVAEAASGPTQREYIRMTVSPVSTRYAPMQFLVSFQE